MAGGLAVYRQAKASLLDQMGYEVAKACFGDPKDGSPKEKACQRQIRTNGQESPFRFFGFEEAYKEFVDRVQEPEVSRAVGQEFMQGRFQERIQVKEAGTCYYAVEVEPPTQKGDLEVRSAKDLEEAKKGPQKQAARQPKAPRMDGPKR